MSDQHLIGTEGDDVLIASDGNDWLEGRGGSDVLMGGLGDDLYEMGPGMGYDLVTDTGGNDEIRFGSGVVADELIRWRDPNGDLTLYVPNSGDMVRITGWFNSPDHQIERFVFDDGTEWDATEAQSLRLLGTAGDDNFGGSDFGETIYARGGNDVLAGGLGDDMYDMGPGMGYDLVLDTGGIDEIRLGSGVVADELARFRDWNGDLVFYRPYSGDMLRIAGWFNSTDNQIERFVFDDGTVWNAAESSALRILGTAGDDILAGTEWSERIEGREGNDQLYGFGGDDILDGGTGNDSMRGGAGDDLYYADSDGDTALEDAGEGIDTVVATVNYQLHWENIENLILVGPNAFGGVGNNGNNVITGNDEGNVLAGREGDDVLIGGAGDDYLVDSGLGNDRLVGGSGSDFMIGEGGDDVYEPGFGGQDTVHDSGGNDELRMGQGITPDQVQREVVGNNLVLHIAGTTDSVTLYNWFFDPSYRIERVVFDDGTVWDADTTQSGSTIVGTEENDFLQGTDLADRIEGRGGHDFIQGLGGDDLLDGGEGNDTIDGGDGSDTYFFGFGSGWDSLHEFSLFQPGTDVLQLGAGITGADLVFQAFFSDLVIGLAGAADAVTLRNFLGFGDTVDVIRFADGSEAGIFRGDGSQTDFFGTGNLDIFVSSNQAETFWGGQGNDLYVQSGSGGTATLDTIQDVAGSSGGNQLLFNTVMPPVDLTIGHRDGYLIISMDDVEIVRLSNFDRTDVFGSHAVEQYSFMDGSSLTYAQLLERGFDIVGGGGFDELQGTNINDRIYGNGLDDALWGYAGSDTLFGGERDDYLWGGDDDDQLIGGEGDDVLEGAKGSDAYYFDRYSGDDFLMELVALEDDPGDSDVIFFSADILPEDLIVSLDALGRFRVDIADSETSITFNAWFNTDISTRVERFVFSNASGTVILTDEYVTALLPDAPVVANPIADQTAAEDAPLSFAVPADAFDDADIPIGDSLAYSARLANGSALPSWLSFDAATRTFSGTPLNQHVGALSIEVTATDETGRSAADVFQLNVTNTNDAPTVASPIADMNARDTLPFSFTVPTNTFVDVDANDTFVFSTGALPSWLSFNAATRTLSGTPTAANIGAVNVTVIATDAAGAAASDTFSINVAPAPDQTITGTSGNNTLVGGSGNDTINGLGGADSMSGMLGNDTYFVDNSGDQVNEAANGGVDTVNSSITYVLPNNVENLTLTGSANRNGTGNALNNTLTGNSGNNTLAGAAGNDTLAGGAGADRFVFSHLGTANADTIVDFQSNDDIHLENAVMTALGASGNFSNNDARFWASASGTAHDASDRIVYNTNTGQLWYDADGTGSGAAQLIATLQNDPTLLASQISVI